MYGATKVLPWVPLKGVFRKKQQSAAQSTSKSRPKVDLVGRRSKQDAVLRRVEIENKDYQKPITTMTGLPWSYRHGIKKTSPPPRPRMGTYIYTYGMLESEIPNPNPNLDPKQNPGTSSHPKEVDLEAEVKHYIVTKSRGNHLHAKTGYTESMTELMKQTGNTLSPSPSNDDFLTLAALWNPEDVVSINNSGSMTSSEIAAATEAFELPGPLTIPKHSEPLPSTSAAIRKTASNKSKKHVPIPVTEKKEPQPSYWALPHLQKKLTEKQVETKSLHKKLIKTGSDLVKRKPDPKQTTILARVSNKAAKTASPNPNQASENRFKNLFKSEEAKSDVLHVIKRPTYATSRENPQRHIQKLPPPKMEVKSTKLKQRRKESIVGTVLREMEETKNETKDPEEPDKEPRKRTKEQEKNRQLALRALENYRLIQERQKVSVQKVPRVTVGRSSAIDTIPKGSEYHEMALNHIRRTHKAKPAVQPDETTRYKAEEAANHFRRSAPFVRPNEYPYPTHFTKGFNPPHPPASTKLANKARSKSKSRHSRNKVKYGAAMLKVKSVDSSDSDIAI